MTAMTVHATPMDICRSAHSGTSSLCTERLGGLGFVHGSQIHAPYPANVALARFGGLSSLCTSPFEDNLLGVTRFGWWVTLRKRTFGTYNVTMAAMLDEQGELLAAESSDAEAVARSPNGSLLVAFQGRPRVRRYTMPPLHPSLVAAMPAQTYDAALDDALAGCGSGSKAISMLNSSLLLAICDAGWAFVLDTGAPQGSARRLRSARYALSGGFTPTDLASLPANRAGAPRIVRWPRTLSKPPMRSPPLLIRPASACVLVQAVCSCSRGRTVEATWRRRRPPATASGCATSRHLPSMRPRATAALSTARCSPSSSTPTTMVRPA